MKYPGLSPQTNDHYSAVSWHTTAHLMPSSASLSTERASTTLLPRTTIGLVSSGCLAITLTSCSLLKFRPATPREAPPRSG